MNDDDRTYTELRMTRRGKILLVLCWIFLALVLGWNLDTLTHAWWMALSNALHFLRDLTGTIGHAVLR